VGNRKRIYSIAFSPNGKYIASGGDDKIVRLFRIDNKDVK
jgi:WD40 repeat protein